MVPLPPKLVGPWDFILHGEFEWQCATTHYGNLGKIELFKVGEIFMQRLAPYISKKVD